MAFLTIRFETETDNSDNKFLKIEQNLENTGSLLPSKGNGIGKIYGVDSSSAQVEEIVHTQLPGNDVEVIDVDGGKPTTIGYQQPLILKIFAFVDPPKGRP